MKNKSSREWFVTVEDSECSRAPQLVPLHPADWETKTLYFDDIADLMKMLSRPTATTYAATADGWEKIDNARAKHA